jgi:hypothetical protein
MEYKGREETRNFDTASDDEKTYNAFARVYEI